MDFLRKINVFGAEHAESVIGVSNLREYFRELAELILKVYLSMRPKYADFLPENHGFQRSMALSLFADSQN